MAPSTPISGSSPNTLILGSYGTTTWNTTNFSLAADGNCKISFAAYNWKNQGMEPVLFVAAKEGSFTGNAVKVSGAAAPITGGEAQASHIGTSLLPEFDGGTLKANVGSVASNFTLTAAGGTIEAQAGSTLTFSGVFSNAAAAPGGLQITSGGAGSEIVLTGASTHTGATLTLTLTAASYSLQNGSVVDVNLGGGVLNTAGAVALNRSGHRWPRRRCRWRGQP